MQAILYRKSMVQYSDNHDKLDSEGRCSLAPLISSKFNVLLQHNFIHWRIVALTVYRRRLGGGVNDAREVTPVLLDGCPKHPNEGGGGKGVIGISYYFTFFFSSSTLLVSPLLAI